MVLLYKKVKFTPVTSSLIEGREVKFIVAEIFEEVKSYKDGGYEKSA